ncbi:UPF0016-domain-containing protein [Saccharata proteae CBS 121410]|uniref:UPF0016-domain-containing protein n=1 Tax=Saccharata proteae CBS 121410 TaxID=1314787 RepID=A0A9P4HQZ3_9PEZI|nr:UPF0016-domain-containing protein [Saccharata proteae CBS 121410]
MILRKRSLPLLLLLLPAITAKSTVELNEAGGIQKLRAAGFGQDVRNAVTDDVPSLPTSKAAVGTKDAPVDGLDGKPHAGPFVVENTKEKPKKPAVADLSSGTGATIKDTLIEQDGVMDDPSRAGPKKGTTGTEGGVTQRNKDRKAQEKEQGSKVAKVPVSPDEARPLPHAEEAKIVVDSDDVDTDASTGNKPKGAAGLEKPTDLPETPYSDDARPVAPTIPKDLDDDLDSMPKAPKTPSGDDSDDDDDDEEGIIQPFHSFVLSLTMILFSEVGDKTFLVAALMAMRHPRVLVFSAAFSALIAMTVLSAVLGHAVPTLLPKRFTSFAAAILFLVFGAKMLREGLAMSPDEGVGEEMKEVEMELEEKEELARKEGRRRSSISPYVLESGRGRSRSQNRLPAHRSPSSSRSRSPSPRGSSISSILTGLNNLFSLLLSPAWVQTFVMTFLGEWGDRSQIATIAMAAGQDYWWVTGGAIAGHAVCTSAAVIGGRAIAGRVSMRVVTLGGAVAFLVFGVIYFLEACYSD